MLNDTYTEVHRMNEEAEAHGDPEISINKDTFPGEDKSGSGDADPISALQLIKEHYHSVVDASLHSDHSDQSDDDNDQQSSDSDGDSDGDDDNEKDSDSDAK